MSEAEWQGSTADVATLVEEICFIDERLVELEASSRAEESGIPGNEEANLRIRRLELFEEMEGLEAQQQDLTIETPVLDGTRREEIAKSMAEQSEGMHFVWTPPCL